MGRWPLERDGESRVNDVRTRTDGEGLSARGECGMAEGPVKWEELRWNHRGEGGTLAWSQGDRGTTPH